MDADEYFRQLLPLGGGPGHVGMATFNLSSTPTSIDLHRVFGNMDGGHAFTVKAAAGQPNPSGAPWKAFFSITATPGNVSDGVASSASGVQGWPLLDGQELKGMLSAGREIATGYATMIAPAMLNMKCNTGSGALYVMRSTIQMTENAVGQFKLPAVPSGFSPAPLGSGVWWQP